MKRNYLVAVDLEGIHGVVGQPYFGLSQDQPDYAVAVENAIKEINVITKALYESGAETVAVWDNHGTGVNLDFSRLDSRVVRVHNTFNDTHLRPFSRFNFQVDIQFDGVLFVGYHAKAGSLGGVLSHTYNSKSIQYYKINGVQVGEFEIDAFVAADKGIPTLFVSSDDVCVAQARVALPHVHSVITKRGMGRNSAEFIDEAVVLDNLYQGVCAAIEENPQPVKLDFPCTVEVRHTRMEDAEQNLKKLQSAGLSIAYGEDAHILTAVVADMAEFEKFMWRQF